MRTRPATATQVFFICCCCLSLGGCIVRPVKPTTLAALPDPAEYIARVTAPPDAPGSLAGIARMTIITPDTKKSFKTIFALTYSEKLRLEVLGLFNQPALYLTSRSDVITIFVPSKNSWYRGPAGRDVMRRISGMPMSPNDIIRTINGIPPGPAPAQSRITIDQDQSLYLFTLEGNGLTQYLWIDPVIQQVVRSQLFEGGIPVHDIRYRRYHTYGERHIPETISILFEMYATNIELRFENILTGSIDDSRYVLEPPPAVAVRPLSEFLYK